MQQPRTRNAHPYTVKENNDHINVVSIALTASDRAMTSRVNADVTEIPDVKYASQKTRGEISFGDAALFPIREISRLFAARIRLTPTARNDIWRKRAKSLKRYVEETC